jgi:hypothetical protein
MCFVIFYTTLVWNISHAKKWVRYDQKCVLVFMQSTRYSCRILMKREFFRHIFEKYLNIKYKLFPPTNALFIKT